MEAANLLLKKFRGRRSDFLLMRIDGHRAHRAGRDLGEDELQSHLNGDYRVGPYPLSPDILAGKGCYFACLDIDHIDEAPPKRAYQILTGLGLEAHLESSKRRGYHLWVLFNEPVLAAKLRAVLTFVGDKLFGEFEFLTVKKKGKPDQPLVEVFPKHDALTDNVKFGYGVQLPLNGDSIKKNRTVFLEPKSLSPYMDQFSYLEKKVIPQGIEKLADACGKIPKQKPKPKPKPRPERKQGGADDDGREVFAEIKAALPILEFVEAETGQRGQVKGPEVAFNCPFHEDEEASLMVRPAKGVFHCHGCNAAGDVFHFYEKMHKATTGEALRELASRTGVELKKKEPRKKRKKKIKDVPWDQIEEQKAIARDESVEVELPLMSGENINIRFLSIGLMMSNSVNWESSGTKDPKLTEAAQNVIESVRTCLNPLPAVFDYRGMMAAHAVKGEDTYTRQAILKYAPVVFLRNRGKFFRDDAAEPKRLWYLDEKNHRLYRIGTGTWDAFVASVTGYTLETAVTNQSLRHCLAEAQTNGEVKIPSRWTHWDKDQKALFVDDGQNGVYKLDGDSIRWLPNGIEALFEPWEFTSPFKIQTDMTLEEATEIWTGDFVELNADPNGPFKAEDLEKLHAVWTISLAFGGLLRTRPIHLAVGPKASGKTTLTRKLGLALFGERFAPTRMSDDAKDMETTLAHQPFIVFDNVELKHRWVEDFLAQAATGIRISRRELFTTFTEVTMNSRAFLAINAIEPKIRRDDIADRLLIFHLERMTRFIPDDILCDDVLKKREKLITAYYTICNSVVEAIRESEGSDQSSRFRMADFARLGRMIYQVLFDELPDVFEDMLGRMTVAQTEHALDTDVLWETLEKWLQDPMNIDREMTTAALYEELEKELDPEGTHKRRWFKNPRSLGRRLSSIKSNLRVFGYQIIQRRGRGEGGRVGTVWRFGREEEGDE